MKSTNFVRYALCSLILLAAAGAGLLIVRKTTLAGGESASVTGGFENEASADHSRKAADVSALPPTMRTAFIQDDRPPATAFEISQDASVSQPGLRTATSRASPETAGLCLASRPEPLPIGSASRIVVSESTVPFG